MKSLSIKNKLGDLANQILNDALSTDDQKQRLEAFKSLTQYFVSTARASKHIIEEPDEDSIINLKERISRSTTKRTA